MGLTGNWKNRREILRNSIDIPAAAVKLALRLEGSVIRYCRGRAGWLMKQVFIGIPGLEERHFGLFAVIRSEGGERIGGLSY
jgi:hypothetical protein